MDAITAKRRVPEFAPGDTVKVMVKVIEDVEDAKGKIKEAAGKVTGSEKLKSEGVADQAAGKVQSSYGDAKEKVKDAIDKI